jgi:hypothetical protein
METTKIVLTCPHCRMPSVRTPRNLIGSFWCVHCARLRAVVIRVSWRGDVPIVEQPHWGTA